MPSRNTNVGGVFVAVLSVLLAGSHLVTTNLKAADPLCTVADAGTPYVNLADALADPACTTIHIAEGTFPTNVTLTRSVVIEGAGPALTRLDGGGMERFRRVILVEEPDVQVELRNLAIVNGDAGSPAGGGIYNGGTMTLVNVRITNNNGGGAGGLYNTGTLTIRNSTIAENTGRSAGAILNDGVLTLENSTLTANQGSTSGIINTNQLTVLNATFSGNRASAGSVINNFSGTMTIAFTTIVSNTTDIISEPFPASALMSNSGNNTLNISATIIAGNGPGPNCSGTITSQGHNLTDDATCSLNASGDQPDTDPLLGALANNGGLTQTHALLPQSPAIDAAPRLDCPATDQRGVTRPASGANEPPCDSGAVEYTAPGQLLYLPLIQAQRPD